MTINGHRPEEVACSTCRCVAVTPAPALTPRFVAEATGGAWLRHPAPKLDAFACIGTDSREAMVEGLFVALRGERHDGHDHLEAAVGAGAAAVMVSRDVEPARLPAAVGVLRVEDGTKALQALASAWRSALGAVVVGITGSAGKTTTRRLVHAALSGSVSAIQSPRSFNNHLGVPLTLLAARPSHRVIVAEIGMNAPGEIATLAEIAQPEIGVVTTVGRAHLAGVGSLSGVAREKSDLLRRVRAGHCRPLAVATAEVPALRPYLAGVPNLMLFGEAADADLRLVDRQVCPDGQRFDVVCSDRPPLRLLLRLPGKHNALNALAAVAVARHLGVVDALIAQRLAEVEPEAMRFQPSVIELAPDAAPVVLVNDAYNANPESMAAALATFGEVCGDASRRAIVLADMLELGPDGEALHAELASRIVELHRRSPLAAVILVGDLMGRAANELRRVCSAAELPAVSHHAVLDASAIERVAAGVRPGDAVLLKGSRGMALERVAAAIAARSSAAAAALASAGHH